MKCMLLNERARDNYLVRLHDQICRVSQTVMMCQYYSVGELYNCIAAWLNINHTRGLKSDETAHSAVSNILHLLLINITDSSKKANILNNFFHSVFSPAEPAPPAVPLSPTTGVTLTSIQLSVLKWLKL